MTIEFQVITRRPQTLEKLIKEEVPGIQLKRLECNIYGSVAFLAKSESPADFYVLGVTVGLFRQQEKVLSRF